MHLFYYWTKQFSALDTQRKLIQSALKINDWAHYFLSRSTDYQLLFWTRSNLVLYGCGKIIERGTDAELVAMM